jgi:hypothetical protein
MIAYKFLQPDAVAPFTGFRWPRPNGEGGEWVEAETVDPCRGGIHACRVRDLPMWIAPELWQIELDGEIVELERKVVASRGRLLRRLPQWDDELRDGFAKFCVDRTRRRVGAVPVVSGFVADVERFRAQRRTAIAGFAAARAAEVRGGPQAYEEERRAQAEWLAQRLGLDGAV